MSNIAATYREQAERAERSKEGEPCEQGDDRRYSDLCAQWKAADANALSVRLGWYGLLGVIAALILNAHSNWIASSTARQQLRPYLSVKTASYAGVYNDAEYPTYTISVQNSGQTPAYDYVSDHDCYIAEKDHIPPPLTSEKLREGRMTKIMGPGQEGGAYSTPIELTPADRAGKIAQTHHVFIRYSAEFSDPFGRRFRFETAVRSLSEMTVNVTPIYAREFQLPGIPWWQRWRRTKR